MESERSTKRALLAAAACEGIYIAIGIAFNLIIGIVTAALITSARSGVSITNAAALFLVIIYAAEIAIAFFQYKIAMRVIPKIAENTPTEILGFRFLAWMMIALNVIDFFLSVSEQSSASMAGIVIGILYLRHAKKIEKGYIAAAKEQGFYVEPEPPKPPILPPQYSMDNDK